MKRQVYMALCLAWVAVFGVAGPSQAVKFYYENLGTLGGDQHYTSFNDKIAGINDLGQAVGHAFTAAGKRHAFFKAPGEPMQDLGLLSGGEESFATCINYSGVIGGYYTDASGKHACLWVPSGGNYTFQDLGGEGSEVFGINDAGYTVGLGQTPAGFFAYVKPPVGDPVNLGALPGHIGSAANGINSSRFIVGYSYDASYKDTACFWEPAGAGYTAAAPLFGEADTKALAVNNLGQACGFKYVPGGVHAVLKTPGDPLHDLGVLYPWNNVSIARDINDSGWVVGVSASGTTAFIWTPAAGMQDLNALLVNPPPLTTLLDPGAISRQGEIVGYAGTTVFKLKPVVEPPYLLLSD